MLSFRELSEKKTKIKINPKKEDVMEKKSDGLKKNHGEDCDCMKCEAKRRADDVNDGPDIANEEIKMTRKAYNKLHRDFKSDDPKKPRTTKYVPGKGTVSMPVKFVDEGHKSCGEGQYYCYDDEKCKPIPEGYKEGKDGMLVKEEPEVYWSSEALDQLDQINERQKDSDNQRLSLERGRSNYGKASIRNVRATGKGGNAADPDERGAAIDARHKAHKEKRGVKTKGMKKESVEGFKRFVECWKTHKKVGMKMKGGKLVPDCRPKNEEVEVTEGSEKSYYLDKEAEQRAQQKARFKAQNKEAARERAAAKRRKERNDLRRQGKYGAVGGYYVTKHMERESVELVDYLKKEAFNFSTNLYKKQQQEIYASKEEVSEESDQKSSESSILTFNEVTRLKKETGYVKGGTKKPTAPKQKDAALDFVKKSITAKYGKGAIMSGGSRQSKKVKGEKSTMGTGKYKKAADAKKQTAADAKKRGFKSTQDYVNTMARYGGKDNYDKGRGLGT